jgi:outer membrane protein assembly factor BamB
VATSTRSTRPSAATSPRPAASGTTTRSAARSRPAAIADGLVYIASFSGYLHCLDAKTGQEYWTHDRARGLSGDRRSSWTARVYLGDEDGDVVVMQHGKEKKVLAEMNMGSAVYSTVVPANGVLFLNNRSQLFALAVK